MRQIRDTLHQKLELRLSVRRILHSYGLSHTTVLNHV